MIRYKQIAYAILFVMLTYIFYILILPTKNILDSINQKSKISTGIYFQSAHSLEFLAFTYISNIQIFKNNTTIANASSACFLNLGIIILGDIKNVSTSAFQTDLNIENTYIFYTPILPTSLYTSSSGNFGAMQASIKNSSLEIKIEPSEKLQDFKNSLTGSAIFAGFTNWQATYAF